MLHSLINHSSDLMKLKEKGYEMDLISDHLIIRNVPYVCDDISVKYGTLVTTLEHNGKVTTIPKDHVVHFIGEYPCDNKGNKLDNIVAEEIEKQLAENLVVNFMFSSKPQEGYKNFYDKMNQYVRILANYAEAVDSSATAQTFKNFNFTEENSVFKYTDSASTRVGIAHISSKLKLEKIAIIGLGGTGSYILDLVSKTHVKEIHLFDNDNFEQHNAFRAPGAASIYDIENQQKKVEYYTTKYEKIRNGIIPHAVKIEESNMKKLKNMEFVFISIDGGEVKLPIIRYLESQGIPFIDVGMDITIVDNSLRGVLRVTTSTQKMRNHIYENNRIGFGKTKIDEVYNQNIQTVDLNALNATLAVIKWKKLFGFYLDFEQEYYSTYTLDGNGIANDDLEYKNGELK